MASLAAPLFPYPPQGSVPVTLAHQAQQLLVTTAQCSAAYHAIGEWKGEEAARQACEPSEPIPTTVHCNGPGMAHLGHNGNATPHICAFSGSGPRVPLPRPPSPPRTGKDLLFFLGYILCVTGEASVPRSSSVVIGTSDASVASWGGAGIIVMLKGCVFFAWGMYGHL